MLNSRKMNLLTVVMALSCYMLPISQAATITLTATTAPSKTAINIQQTTAMLNNIRTGMQQRTLPTSEVQLLANIRSIANDVNGLYVGVGDDPITARAIIRDNFQVHLNTVDQLSSAYYGRTSSSTSKITMAKNTYILMRYNAITRHNPDFYWARLGIFAANEVRSNLALAFSLKSTLDTLISQTPNAANITIANMSLPKLSLMVGGATNDLLQGQQNVLSDIGSLALLHKRFGASTMATISGNISAEAQLGYRLQAQADAAKNRGQTANFQSLATDSAVQFGIHEQTYLLQSMWDQPNIKALAQINAWMLSQSLETIGMRGDIYVGTNKFVPYIGPYLIIRAPFGATDLSSVIDRIAIARNGFIALNQLRQTPAFDTWITQSQTWIGNAQGIYQPMVLK